MQLCMFVCLFVKIKKSINKINELGYKTTNTTGRPLQLVQDFPSAPGAGGGPGGSSVPAGV